MAKKKAVLRFVPVSERALVQRLRRVLAKDGVRLLANRGRHDLGPVTIGPYYIVDSNQIMTDHCVDLVEYGRKLGVLRPWEQLVEAAGERTRKRS
jgi:hypothetical protein